MSPLNEHKDMIAISAYRNMEDQLLDDIADLRFENAGLRVQMEQRGICTCKGSEQEGVLLAKIEQVTRKNAIQGLHLATMADVVLGEDAEDRSDETLVREVCRMARQNRSLVNVLEALAKGKDVPGVTVDEIAEYAQRAVNAARKEQP